MRIAECDIVFVSGEKKPGKDHWISRWAERFPNSFQFSAGEAAALNSRINAFLALLEKTSRPVVLVAQGSGVLLFSQAYSQMIQFPVRGAFLVAPYKLRQKELSLITDYHNEEFSLKSVLVASRTDESSSFSHAQSLAERWNIPVLDAGEAGTLDERSGHGPWPEGLMSFANFLQTV